MKFKVGDKVICVEDYPNLGVVFTVDKDEWTNSKGLKFIEVKESWGCYLSKRFVLDCQLARVIYGDVE